jgi:hypothetical protein
MQLDPRLKAVSKRRSALVDSCIASIISSSIRSESFRYNAKYEMRKQRDQLGTVIALPKTSYLLTKGRYDTCRKGEAPRSSSLEVLLYERAMKEVPD